MTSMRSLLKKFLPPRMYYFLKKIYHWLKIPDLKRFIYNRYFWIYLFIAGHVLKNRKTSNVQNDEFIEQCNAPGRRHSLIPKIIWIYWDQTEVPFLVNKCIGRVHKLHPDYKIQLINASNLLQFLPDLKFPADDISIPHKTGIIRLELLFNYGGVWLDSSVILNQKIDWIHAIDHLERQDLVGFYINKRTSKSDDDRLPPVIENWFIAAPIGSPLIAAWLVSLNPLKHLGYSGFIDMLKSQREYYTIASKISYPNYLLAHMALQFTLYKNNEYNFYVKKAQSNALFYQRLCKLCNRKIAVELMIKTKPAVLPMLIKLRGGDRRLIESVWRRKRVNPKSIIGELLNE